MGKQLIEISEILTEEFQQFEINMNKLIAFKKELNIGKVKLDTNDFQSILSEFEEEQTQQLKRHDLQIAKLIEQMSKKNSYPKWQVIGFVCVIVCIVFFIGYNQIKVQKLQSDLYEIANEKQVAIKYFTNFINDNSIVKKEYLKWKKIKK